MALVLPFCYRCVICCLVFLLVVAQDGNYQNEQYGREDRQQLQEQTQQRNVKSHSSLSSSASHTIIPSAAEKKTTVDSTRQSVSGVNREKTGHYFREKRIEERRLDPDNNAGNVNDIYNTNKRQPATDRVHKLSSTVPENVEGRNKFKKRRDHQKKALRGNSDVVANLSNKFNPDGSEDILPSKEEYLQRYYEMNRKGKPNTKQEKKDNIEEKNQEVVTPSFKPMTESASLSRKAQDESENSDNATDDVLTKNKRRKSLYVYDQYSDDEVFDHIENDENDDMNYIEYVSKYTGSRVKRHVPRIRDDWAYEDDHNVDYEGLDYRERNKDRHSGRRNRNRRGKGRGSNSNGHDRSSLEIDPNLDPESYDDPDHSHYHISRSPRRRISGKGGGGGGGKRSEGGEGGGGRGSSRDRRYGNRHPDYDSSERGYSDPEGYTEKRTHIPLSSPSLSPSRHSDSYNRYSDDSARARISKSSSQKTCQICTMKKMDREMRLRTLKAQIIKQIGLNELPNITKNDRILPKVPTLKHIIENMTMQRDEPSWRDSPDDKSDDISEQMIITAEKRK